MTPSPSKGADALKASDRPATKPEDEIEVTEEMISAGRRYLNLNALETVDMRLVINALWGYFWR